MKKNPLDNDRFAKARLALFKHMSNTHNLVLLESEMDDIEDLAVKVAVARALEEVALYHDRPNIQGTIKRLFAEFEVLTPEMVSKFTGRISPRQALSAFRALRTIGGTCVKHCGTGMESAWMSLAASKRRKPIR